MNGEITILVSSYLARLGTITWVQIKIEGPFSGRITQQI